MKRKRAPAAELTEAYFESLDLAAAGHPAASRELLRRVLSPTPRAPGSGARERGGGDDIPPRHIILSTLHNQLAELCVDDMLSEPSRSAEHQKDAVAHAEAALAAWPQNSAAALTLAQLLRESGDLERALVLYRNVSRWDVPRPSRSAFRDNDDSNYDWRREFIHVPHHHHCLPVALYNLAIILSQMGRHREASVPIGRMGYRARIAPNVWRSASQNSALPSLDEDTPASAPVHAYPQAIPGQILGRLQVAFREDAKYWSENEYESSPGYFSWWYDVAKAPSNLVEDLIHDVMLPIISRIDKDKDGGGKAIVGAEWWVHKRKIGRNLGHALHWDTDENSLNRLGEDGIRHPCWSSVCYIDGISHDGRAGAARSGKTVVFDGKVDASEYPKKCWVAKPSKNGDVLVFDGSLLHGVLPGRSGGCRADKQRLTLMVGFWSVDINRQASGRSSRRRGGGLSLPRPVRSTQWPNDLATARSDGGPPRSEKTQQPQRAPIPPDPTMVRCCAPAFVEVPASSVRSDAEMIVPPSSIQQRFWVRDSGSFRRALLDTREQ